MEVVQYKFTHKQYTEYRERNIHNNKKLIWLKNYIFSSILLLKTMTYDITGKVIPVYDVQAHYKVEVQHQTFVNLALDV
jgi:hypothetical protein